MTLITNDQRPRSQFVFYVYTHAMTLKGAEYHGFFLVSNVLKPFKPGLHNGPH